MGERGVVFTDVYNFRDLGGYPAADGRTVAWRRLYRSDDLARLSATDLETFAALGIRTVIDLRRPTEVAELGRFPETDGVEYHHIHLPHPAWPSQQRFTDTADRIEFVVERYREMSVASADGFGAALRLIADVETAPLVFHCIAGKDRTGILSALTLSLLGVDDDTVADDYALSEAAEPQAWVRWAKLKPGLVRPENVTISPREAMLRFLTDIRERHESVAGYVASVGVTDDHIAALRRHLLTR